MKTKSVSCFLIPACIFLSQVTSFAAIEQKSAEPYLGAIVIDADTGQILFEDQSDVKCYPASVLKMMDLLIILDKIGQGSLKPDEKILITAEASKIGGSQVYLKENEVFTVDELLYALMVQSANDAATALAIHIAGSKEGFVALMNERAKQLGMKATEFHSIHGLPPGKDQLPDVTTARDLSRLARELLKYPDCLRYTSCREHEFRNGKFMLRTHNRLLASFPGCDGFKTGYFSKAGYSIAATAKRGNTRLIAVVLGSRSKNMVNKAAAELLTKGFARMAELHPATPPPAVQPPVTPPPETEEEQPRRSALFWPIMTVCGLIIIGGAVWLALSIFRSKNMPPGMMDGQQ